MINDIRSSVLSMSLELESELSEALALLFKFEKDKSKTLGYHNSALSFKTKVDLLKDLGRLDDDAYNDFVVFMEIRNKLIHVLEIDTLLKAVKVTKNENKLFNHDKELHKEYKNFEIESLKESCLKQALTELFIRLITVCYNIKKSAMEEEVASLKTKMQAAEADNFKKFITYLNTALNKFSHSFESLVVYNSAEVPSAEKGFITTGLLGFLLVELQNTSPELLEIFTSFLKDKKDE